MKFTTAWVKTAAENVTLKVATVTLTIVTLAQLVVIVAQSQKELPVIEKGCFSRALSAKPVEAGKNEVDSFLVESLAMRFDSDSYIRDGFLSLEELAAREKEQLTLKQRQITQKIILNDIKNDEKEIVISLDRLLSVGKVKSVLPLKIKVNLQKTNRTEANPYGLVLSSVNQVEEKEEK